MVKRPRHTSKEIEKVIQYAESLGWRVEKRNGHSWGRIFCPQADRTGCMISIYSTPRNAANHAKTIRRLVDKCNCTGDDNEDV